MHAGAIERLGFSVCTTRYAKMRLSAPIPPQGRTSLGNSPPGTHAARALALNIAIYNLHLATLGGGERRTAALAAHLAKSHRVTLFGDTIIDPARLREIFSIDLSGIEIVPLRDNDHLAEIRARAPDLFINNSHSSDLPCPAPLGIYMCMFPETYRINLRGYQTITANSAFTARWIAKRWGYPAEIVYSACRSMGPASAKQNIILNVGRFFADSKENHHKRQDVLLEAFKTMVDEGLEGWSLHLVGNVGQAEEDREFVEALRQSARDYPVRILPALDGEALREAYRHASFYWHATGFGTSAAEQPSKQEHFGMTIIEAMSAGCVPFAFNSGGPRESITSGVSGYLWNDLADLRRLTRALMADRRALEAMSAAAAAASAQFNVEAFLSRMDAIITRLATGGAGSRHGAIAGRMGRTILPRLQYLMHRLGRFVRRSRILRR